MYYNVTEARSRNRCCRGIAISITYFECVCSRSYPARKAHEPCYIVICGLADYRKMFFDILYIISTKLFSF